MRGHIFSRDQVIIVCKSSMLTSSSSSSCCFVVRFCYGNDHGTLELCSACLHFLLPGRTIWGLLVERTPTIKSTKALKVKSQFSVLMNCILLIVGVHLYL